MTTKSTDERSMTENEPGKRANSTGANELTVTRMFDAPPERVFEAWTDPERVARWWGPNGFTTTVGEMDVRPGGVWRFVMCGSDGVEYRNEIVYDEIVEPERLVYTHGADEAESHEPFRMTVTVDEYDGDGAELTMRMRFESAAEREKQEAFGALEGANQSLARLDEHLTIRGDVRQ